MGMQLASGGPSLLAMKATAVIHRSQRTFFGRAQRQPSQLIEKAEIEDDFPAACFFIILISLTAG
jgi:hypothetical protein